MASTSKVFSMGHINQLIWVPAANIPSHLKWFLGLFSDFATSLIATEFAEAQRTDASLQVGWTCARRGSQEFKVINGLLYKRTQNGTNNVEDNALAVPQKYRDELLAVSHNCITAGHVGTSKSRQRLQAYFYWPKLQRDVADYVRKCRICQLTAPLKTDDRAPLQSMTPTLDTPPFSSISIDILGPELSRTARSNRFLLCILCNSTKYLQVCPLRNLKAASICDKLLSFWCTVGLPNEIFCDQMSSVTWTVIIWIVSFVSSLRQPMLWGKSNKWKQLSVLSCSKRHGISQAIHSIDFNHFYL